MHGLFLLKLRPYIAEKLLHEEEGWNLLFQRAGVEYTVFVPQNHYEARVVARLYYAAAELRSEDYTQFLQGYGRYIVSDLIQMYAHLFSFDGLTTFDLLHRLEDVYKRYRDQRVMDPPRINFDEASKRKGILYYRSSHEEVPGLCHMAHGMLLGAADFVNQRIAIHQTECVDEGSPVCAFELRPLHRGSSSFQKVRVILNESSEDSEDDG